MCNIRCGAIRWQMHDFLSDGNSNVCSISDRLRDFRKRLTFYLENEDQGQAVEERDLRYLTANVIFFRTLSTWEHTLLQTGITHKETVERSHLMTKGKSC